MHSTSTELCSMKEWKIYTSLPKLTPQNPIHTTPDSTLIQGHRSWCGMCNGHQTNIILGLAVSHSTLHVSSQVQTCNLTLLYFTSTYMSFKLLLRWDQLRIASYGPVTQPQKVLPCVLITNGRVSGNWGCIFKTQRSTLCFHHVTKSEGRIISLNQLTAEFISTEAYIWIPLMYHISPSGGFWSFSFHTIAIATILCRFTTQTTLTF